MAVEKNIANLQKQIDELKGEKKDSSFTTDVTVNPFSKLKKLTTEQGSTGDATYRRLSFMKISATLLHSTVHGSLPANFHYDLANSNNVNVAYERTVLPSDYIKGGFPTLHILWGNTSNSGNIELGVTLESVGVGSTTQTDLYVVQTAITAPSAANTLEDLSFNLAKPNSLCCPSMTRQAQK